ncbi:dUTP diphosphatase [Paenisporosarcina sp. TG20]|uniref:dUTP diphosphatase n=1 Tax=Paenisporosarcina sp. TG20 TaxID=1211706 RepID=UPI0002FC9A7D|nr:dUTP diphosphatase [Paenisporosarcina sp. TG20]
MYLKKLFDMQRSLDSYIQTEKNISRDVFLEKGLALSVELAELANETRCFKFWSEKGPSEDNVILEEYVDSIHFLLSLGNDKQLNDLETWPANPDEEGSLTMLFIHTQVSINQFLQVPTKENYKNVWSWYGAIASNLGFTHEQILQGYINKNEKNYERQRVGY